MAYALFPTVTGKIAVCVYRPLFTPLLYRSRFTVVPFPCFLGESFRPKSAGTKQQMGVMITVVSLAVWLVDSKIYGHLVLDSQLFGEAPNHPGAGGGVQFCREGNDDFTGYGAVFRVSAFSASFQSFSRSCAHFGAPSG